MENSLHEQGNGSRLETSTRSTCNHHSLLAPLAEVYLLNTLPSQPTLPTPPTTILHVTMNLENVFETTHSKRMNTKREPDSSSHMKTRMLWRWSVERSCFHRVLRLIQRSDIALIHHAIAERRHLSLKGSPSSWSREMSALKTCTSYI